MKYKHLQISIVIFLLVSFFQIQSSQAQTIKILGGNTLNGAVNGTILGGATMALQNSNDFYEPLRVGLGAGTLYGLSVGIYDISQTSTGQQYYVSGTFNDGDNSTIIVLLDTIYGAAGGAIVATSFNLIADRAIEEGLQYGAGVGAWAGFGFGLIDTFLLARRAGDFQSAATPASSPQQGMISFADQTSGYSINLLNPTIFYQTEINSSDISVQSTVGIDLVNFQLQL
ncbi:hypothetical protein NC796_19355 [Aliifodinibius sp. S!AR15-10]|uniref:hypothetical protein n=1 Tax=Aliifodinibius sp. S!AR15-10 TaxID=2950437 RepID=UPI002855D43E|nr:hypothetical protein [Aliifodinibius sp. S!AR15-10]MDR8393321.1 hypothetical protein [Aliifodinibius sp. S!AR15-10]